MEPTGFDHHGPDHSNPSPQGALPSARMSTEEVLKALGRYTEESHKSDRQTATKLGLMSEHVFFEYRAKLMSTPHVEEQGEPIHYLIKMEIGAGLRRPQGLLKQEARDLILFSVNPDLTAESAISTSAKWMKNGCVS
jgi:hypothetical protein